MGSDSRNGSLRAAAVAEAISWLRTPYHHHACVKGSGVDCAQILLEVYNSIGLVNSNAVRQLVGHYAPGWHLHRSEELYIDYVKRYAVKAKVPRPGDFALFRYGRTASHAAIVVEWPDRLIHAYVMRGVVWASLNDRELLHRDGTSRLDSIWNPFKD